MSAGGASEFCGCGGFRLLVGDSQLEVFGDSLGFCDGCCGYRRGEDFVCGFGEEGEPALEVVRVEGELEVGHQRLAFVAAGREKNSGPEIFKGGEVMGPVVDDGVEDGTDVGVEADFVVEAIDEGADLWFGDLLFGCLFGVYGVLPGRLISSIGYF